jgi:predicted NAD/FAD-dependent oxidoreductase
VTNKAAIVGAGLAGLSCARTLRRAGFAVDVFEQRRTIGGRVATSRIGDDTFDHGAQYLTARTNDFGGYLNEIAELGYASRWTPRSSLNGQNGGGQLQPWIVGTPGMSSIVRPLTEGVRVSTGKRVHALERRERGWHIRFDDEASAGPFQAVAVTVPAPEAEALLGNIKELAAPLSRVRMMPCWSLMVRIEDKILPEQDVFSDMSEVIRWVAKNNSKPGRNPAGENIVIHASPKWSRKAENADPDEVAQELWSEVSHALALPPVRPSRMTAHLWRNGIVDQTLGETHLYSHQHRAGMAGDWCYGRLAEHAFESGARLGRAIVESLT